jgi:hypothetical protein
MKMLALMLTVLSILSGSLNAQQPDHDTVGAVPDEATKSLLTARFKRGLDIAGIMGVGKDVQACYDDAYLPKTNAAKLSKCMLYDSAAYRMDKGMHGVMAMRGETFDQARYFADAPFALRLSFYGKSAFGGSDDRANRFLVASSLEVMKRVARSAPTPEFQFVCPESLPNENERIKALVEFLVRVKKERPDLDTQEKTLGFRYTLLNSHHCAETLKNMQDKTQR